MKFEEALEGVTATPDVKGIPGRMGPIVRRKLPVEPTNIVVYAKKKKKKKSRLAPEKIIKGSAAIGT